MVEAAAFPVDGGHWTGSGGDLSFVVIRCLIVCIRASWKRLRRLAASCGIDPRFN